ATFRRSSRWPARSSFPASASSPPWISLLAPRVVERVRDLMLAADPLHRAVAAQPGQHNRDLVVRRPRPGTSSARSTSVSLSVERPILSRPPASLSGITRLRDCPALHPGYLSAP